MAGKIFNLQDDGRLVEMHQEGFVAEEDFQLLLEQYPDLLAGDQIHSDDPRRWLLIKREMGVADQQEGSERWSLDHLFVDHEGIPTLVEVKRATDTRIRREVVGQIFDYAANAVVYWSIEQIRAEFDRLCTKRGVDAEECVAEFIGNDSDVSVFWQQVKTNLQAGRIRMLIVADVIPKELQRIVEFLNQQMDPAEILAIEIGHFVGQGIKTLVPRVIGKTAEAEAKKQVGGTPSFEQLQIWADEKGVGELHAKLTARFSMCFPAVGRTKTGLTYKGITNDSDGKPVAVLRILAGESVAEQGVRYAIYIDRLAECLGCSKAEVESIIPEPMRIEPTDWVGTIYHGFVQSEGEFALLFERLKQLGVGSSMGF